MRSHFGMMALAIAALSVMTTSCALGQNEVTLDLSTRSPVETDGGVRTERAVWRWDQTAVILCDFWDAHHSIEAVRRMAEFSPRVDAVLKQARSRGATIIHAPSDCMPHYADHPARRRAQEAPHHTAPQPGIDDWCSSIETEQAHAYPIDQSDGGEDDRADEHAAWAASLQRRGRSPGTPWLTQSDAIVIDADRDYISDRGQEIWNIVRSRGCRQVVLLGVHTNMCVLGRPFGLRQWVRQGVPVALVRDLTDSMYCPRSFPYVSHAAGHEAVLQHVERRVCPSITSGQLLGDGVTFQFAAADAPRPRDERPDHPAWATLRLPGPGPSPTHASKSPWWCRAAVAWPREAGIEEPIELRWEAPAGTRAWINGHALEAWNASPPADPSQRGENATVQGWSIPASALNAGEANLLVLRLDEPASASATLAAPVARWNGQVRELVGGWQSQSSDDPTLASIPLPAKFGMPPNAYHELRY